MNKERTDQWMKGTRLGTAGRGRVGDWVWEVRARSRDFSAAPPWRPLCAGPAFGFLHSIRLHPCLVFACLRFRRWGGALGGAGIVSSVPVCILIPSRHSGPTASVCQQEQDWEVMGSGPRSAPQRQRPSCFLLSRRWSGKVAGKAFRPQGSPVACCPQCPLRGQDRLPALRRQAS